MTDRGKMKEHNDEEAGDTFIFNPDESGSEAGGVV